jgi:hypothetical protein
MRTTPRATPQTTLTPRPTRAALLATLALPETASTPATPTASLGATQTPLPIPTQPVVIRPPTPSRQTNEQIWRAQQRDRRSFDPPQAYVARPSATLLWYDPRTGQSLEIGTLLGEFQASAEFRLRGSDQPAIEVPYRINNDFGLTAISDAIVRRMNEAGYSERVDAYVLLSEAVQPR